MKIRLFRTCSSISCDFLQKYYVFLISVFILLLIVFVSNLASIGVSYSSYIMHQMKYNIYEYNEIDLEQLCRISNCKYVLSMGDEEKIFAFSSDKQTLFKTNNYVKTTRIFENYFIDNNYNILLYNVDSNSYFALDLDIFYKELKSTYFCTFALVYFITFFYLFFSYKKEVKDHILQTIGSEAILANQSMVMITENVHHELNTPLEVIDNKIEKIHRCIVDYLLGLVEINSDNKLINNPKFIALNRSLVNMEQDFTFVKTASEQIYSVLEKMKGFKHLRYSNGNKTLFDICEGAVKIMNISNSGFESSIDSNLKDYRIKHTGDKELKNVDLLNVILNHLKNSLEAKANNISLQLYSFNNNILKLHIIDNGNGITKEVINKIFLPNFSTKKETKAIRGNGMYLNKFIMEACGGDINVIDTSNNGTIIEISLQANYHEYRIY